MDVGRALPVVEEGAATAAALLSAATEIRAEAVDISEVVDVASRGATISEAEGAAVVFGPAWTWPSLIWEMYSCAIKGWAVRSAKAERRRITGGGMLSLTAVDLAVGDDLPQLERLDSKGIQYCPKKAPLDRSSGPKNLWRTALIGRLQEG